MIKEYKMKHVWVSLCEYLVNCINNAPDIVEN